jgi:spore coat polysaccharide biosynthesis protein SpsF
MSAGGRDHRPRVVAVVSARMASSRYPGKAMAPLAGRPLLAVLLERMAAARGVDGVVLATSSNPENDVLHRVAAEAGFAVFRGDEEDVLRRHVECAHAVGAEHVVRVTGDNPLTDIETLEHLVALQLAGRADYTYVPGDALLMGILPEVVRTTALQASWQRGEARHRSELVTLYIKEHPDEFRIRTSELPQGLYRPAYRLTVDEAEDVAVMQGLFERLSAPGKIVTTREAVAVLDREPELAAINAHLRHKAANLRSVELDLRISGSSR